jgi:hypothetical protein
MYSQSIPGRAVLIDSLADLQLAAIDETRFREFMYSLVQRFARQGITVLSTYETPGPGGGGRLPESARGAGSSRSSLTGVAGNRARTRACWAVITMAVAWLTGRRRPSRCALALS